MSGFPDSEKQKKIYNLIFHNPGVHLSKIAELLNMKISEVEYYLQYFEKKGIINVTKEAGYERYYIEDRRVKTRDKRTLGIRKEIYDIVAKNPGLYLSKIAEMLDMSIPLTDYHLRYMERNREIIAVKDARGYYKRCYIAESRIESQDKKVLEVLGKKIPLKIVLFLLKRSNLKHKEILKRLDISSSTLSYHLTKLVNTGILDVRSYGKEKGYTLKDRDEIIRTLKKYELHIELQLAIEGFKDLWENLQY